MKIAGINEYVYNLSIVHDVIDDNNMINTHKNLMKKNTIWGY